MSIVEVEGAPGLYTCILALTLNEAEEAAFNLGIQAADWFYPDASYKVRGDYIEQLIYVSGWERSAILTGDVLDELVRVTTERPPLHTLEQPTTAEFLTPVPPSPFVEPFVPEITVQRRSWLRRMLGKLW